MTAQMKDEPLNDNIRVAVLGCGYVGLSVIVGAVRAGYEVLGVDPDIRKVDLLSSGTPPTADVGLTPAGLQALLETGRLRFEIKLDIDPDVAIICVPTPLREGQPDISYIESAGEMLSERLREGALVVLESTTDPGTTEGALRPILEEGSGLQAGRDFHLAHSPERIDPGNKAYGLQNTPKIVGGLTPACTARAAAFYEGLCDHVVQVSSPRAAEMTKLLENSFRHVNIALANEMSIVCHDLGIDPWEVIDAAATKPFGFTPFRPGPGVGGHCIPVDPQYLAWRVRGAFGHQFRMLEVAQDINERMPAYVAQRTAEILNEQGKAVRGARILVLGVAYKAGSDDTRESPSLRVAQRLTRMGAELSYHDPHVHEVELAGAAQRSIDLSEGMVKLFDAVIVLTDHPGVDYAMVVGAARILFDTRNATAGLRGPNVHRA